MAWPWQVRLARWTILATESRRLLYVFFRFSNVKTDDFYKRKEVCLSIQECRGIKGSRDSEPTIIHLHFLANENKSPLQAKNEQGR
jgi:hypothetical protein